MSRTFDTLVEDPFKCLTIRFCHVIPTSVHLFELETAQELSALKVKIGFNLLVAVVYVLVCSWAWTNRLRDILGFDRDQICEAGLQQYAPEVSRERGIEYVKYLNTIDRSTRVIVTREDDLV